MVGNIRPDDLTAQTLKAILDRNPDFPKKNIEDVVLGCGYPEGSQGMLLARSAAVLAGIPIEAGAKVVNRLCGSSMDAVHQISRAVEIGDLEVGIAAGVEDMFSIPRGGFNPVYNSELEKQNYYIDMGLTAENLAAEINISREDQETFSIASHEKALTAQAEGRFHNEIVPVKLEDGTTVEADEGPRSPDLEKIHSLKPAFSEKGTVTAATSSPFSIGAGAAILTSRQFAEKHSLNIRAEIVSRAVVGVEWERMGMGPLPATEKALHIAGLTMDNIDIIELNEAFAAQVLGCVQLIESDQFAKKKLSRTQAIGRLEHNRLNVNGGAIALGHPVGVTGNRLILTALKELRRRRDQYALVSLCIGGGQGGAIILERAS